MEMIFDSEAYKKYFVKVIIYWFMFGTRYPPSKYILRNYQAKHASTHAVYSRINFVADILNSFLS